MKMRFLTGLFGLSALLLVATGCRKQDDPVALITNPIGTGSSPSGQDTAGGLQFRFSPVVNGQPLVLDSAWYTNTSGDSFRVSSYRYYVSHVALHSPDGSVTTLPETYMLIDARLPELRSIKGIRSGTYDRISFMIGVDSAHNVSGAQDGDLSQAKGMFWDWKSGYIMSKLEGFSPQSTIPGTAFFYHVAGYTGKYNALRTVELPLPSPLRVAAGKMPTLQVQSDIASWFSGTTPISIRDLSAIMSVGPESVALANNYIKGFSIVRIDP
ncbi:MAG: hypothetical protein EOP52_03405 [Sphingobacteriales bacterium]|nr:MAG: hypothetical protein EOP52_03405 [Sphingobacteriales bacterium]